MTTKIETGIEELENALKTIQFLADTYATQSRTKAGRKNLDQSLEFLALRVRVGLNALQGAK